MADTKQHWKEIVEPDDLDAHMVEVGQAKVNAEIVKGMLTEFPLPEGGTLYVPGCGTGQMFDFLAPSELGPVRYLFADIKPEFLQKLRPRIPAGISYRSVIDDVEETRITEKVDAVLIVLLLQHIDWKKGLRGILGTRPARIFLIVQQQEATDAEINRHRRLRPSMQKFAAVAKTELVKLPELEAFLAEGKYVKRAMRVEAVPNTKRMVGLVFERHE